MPFFNKTAEELETNFEKWLFVLKNIEKLTEIPSRLKNKIFMKFFGEAEIANLAQEERAAYEQSLKVYRDLKNVTDTAFIEGYGVAKQEAHNKFVNAIKKAISLGNSIQETAEIFEISESEVEKYLNQ
ncbi:MAG: PD-(D/E)XK nuclease family transposase [Saprospiraceae bacterium]|nr:PD-(D/E)XK nuclease family transposase [Saprospiraceae bacterium]